MAYYGDVPYKYSGGSHSSRKLSENPRLAELSVAVEDFCIERGINFSKFNSVMVTKYDSHQSCIPPHSDDESSILPDSVILTVSLGATRQVIFRRKPPGTYSEEILEVGHGEVYTMTRSSQDHFDHTVPKMRREDCDGPRISLTYRSLRTLRSPLSPNNQGAGTFTQPPQAPVVRRSFTPPRRKVLILSDSKNRSFDCSMFKDRIVAFRKDMFYLKDLYMHREAIEQSDIVLISAGLNDIRHNKVDAQTLHDHIKHFTAMFDNTQFLFDSISPLNMHADRFNVVNHCIDQTNELLLQFSLRCENFRLFDNLCFGLPHLAKDGIHFNLVGKSVLSNCWFNVVLIRLGFKRGFLPLRHNFWQLLTTLT